MNYLLIQIKYSINIVSLYLCYIVIVIWNVIRLKKPQEIETGMQSLHYSYKMLQKTPNLHFTLKKWLRPTSPNSTTTSWRKKSYQSGNIVTTLLIIILWVNSALSKNETQRSARRAFEQCMSNLIRHDNSIWKQLRNSKKPKMTAQAIRKIDSGPSAQSDQEKSFYLQTFDNCF